MISVLYYMHEKFGAAQSCVEAKIYSWTDIFSDHRLQRSKHGSNCGRSSEQQDILALGYFSIAKTFVVHRNKKSCSKIHCKTMHNFFAASSEKQSSCPSIGLVYKPIWCCTNCQIWLATQYNTWLSYLSINRISFSKDRCLNGCNISFAKSRVKDVDFQV